MQTGDCMDTTRAIGTLRPQYAKRLQRFLLFDGRAAVCRCGFAVDAMLERYEARVAECMAEREFGADEHEEACYLNVYSALGAYEVLREAGFTEEEGFAAYNYMAKALRRTARMTHVGLDLLPNAFQLLRDSLLDDLTGPKRVCWATTLLRDDADVFEYKITRCLYHEVCAERGYPEFTRAFCDHDHAAFDHMGRNVEFIRHECFGEGGSCCHDEFRRR